MRKIGISMAVLVVMLGASLTVAAEDDLDSMARRLRALEFSVARITAQLAYVQEPAEIEGTVALLSGIGSDVHVLQFGADLFGKPRNAVLALPNPRPAGEVPW